MKKKARKKEVYFIATKYKNQPVKIDFYTKTGESIPSKEVKKEETKAGPRFFTLAGI